MRRSKYEERGAYHYAEFADPDSIYHKHVVELVTAIGNHVKINGDILDVGCGEGLIMSELGKKGFKCCGCDIDKRAVSIALEKGHDVVEGTIDLHTHNKFDAVLLCDVLEHVEDFDGTIETAKELAPVIVVAVPNRHDPHAVRQDITGSVVDCFTGWKFIYCLTRHARRVMIFEKVT